MQGDSKGKALCVDFSRAVVSCVVMEWRQLSLRMPPSSSAVALPHGQLFPPTHTHGPAAKGLVYLSVGEGVCGCDSADEEDHDALT